MLSRTLRLAALAILTGSFSGFLLAPPALGQNLDAGKTPAQLFGGSCNACHKSARGLLRTVAPGSLPGFLRQHYTTSSDMAKVLSSYLLANGATEQPRVANVPVNRQGRDPQPQAAPAAPDPRQARRPDADGLNPPGADSQRPLRNAKQAARTEDAQAPAAPKGAAKNTKRGASPTEAATAPAATADSASQVKPALTGEAAIAAAVPMPEPAGLPPPAIGDFKIDPPKDQPKIEAAKTDAPGGDAPKQEARVDPKPDQQKAEQPKPEAVTSTAAAPSAPAAAAQPLAPPRTSSASLTPKPAAGPPPAPPISH